MKVFTLLLVFILSTNLYSQTKFQKFNNEHRIIEAERKAKALEKAFKLNSAKATEDGRGYNVSYYGLSLDLFPSDTSMFGSVKVKATVSSAELDEVVLDFNTYLTVDSVIAGDQKLNFTHEDNSTQPNDLERHISFVPLLPQRLVLVFPAYQFL